MEKYRPCNLRNSFPFSIAFWSTFNRNTFRCNWKKEIVLHKAELLLLGITFKENCPDVRNTKIVDIVHSLKEYGINITIYDPWAKPEEVLHEYGIVTTKTIPTSQFDAVILGVSHTVFNTLNIDALTKSNNVVYDVKGFLTAEVDGRL